MARSTRPRIEGRRIYDDLGREDAERVLVDRLWPRGVKKEDAALDEWAKDVAPSTELRRWYAHDPDRFAEFSQRYRRELTTGPASQAVEHLLAVAKQKPLVLLTATRDVERSGMAVLLEHLRSKAATRRR
jgi:uncharacterized protein YeaO (DUF488 family)